MKRYKLDKLWLIILFLATLSCRDENFPTPVAATIQTIDVTNIGGSTAISGGEIISNGGQKISTRGICWDTIQNPEIGINTMMDTTGLDKFSCQISGLVGATTYFVRAFATNNGGISYGNSIKFTTKAVPCLTTNVVTGITGTSAICGGVITKSFGAQIVQRGVCWSTSVNPSINDSKTTDGTGVDSFTSAITNLSPSTTYHVRAYATTSNGDTGYGNDIVFNTQITDYDGNIYTSVKIGEQIWMVENFRSTHFTDGTEIAVAYNGADTNKEYGPSYSWNDIIKPNFAPQGWHVATDAEWRALYDFVGGSGLKLKEKGTKHWNTNNGTNETGFTAFGSAHVYGAALKAEGTWWAATENTSTDGLRWSIFDSGDMGRYANDKSMLFTVRLVKNK